MTAEKEFIFKNNKSLPTGQLLRQQELFDSKLFSDFNIVDSEGNILKAHRFLLFAASPVMKAMFESTVNEKDHQVMLLEDIDLTTMAEILRYMYTQKWNRESALAPKVLYGAEKYGLKRLKAECLEVLKKNLCFDNVLEYFALADRFGNQGLLTRCMKIVKL